MSISSLVGAPAPVPPASTGSSAPGGLAALKQQEAKLVAQLKATQNDKSLSDQARAAKVAQLNAQKTQLDAQIRRLGTQQSPSATEAEATTVPEPGVHVVA